MKISKKRFFLAIILLASVGCSTPYSSNKYSNENISIQSNDINLDNIKNAKHFVGLIWQDTKDNIEKKFTHDEAEMYCKNLRLFDTDKWRLPSNYEVKELSKLHSKKYFDNILEYKSYHTHNTISEDDECKNQTYDEIVNNTKYSCIYSYSYIFKRFKIMKNFRKSKSYARCVLSEDDYIQAKQHINQAILDANTDEDFESLLTAFKYTKDMSYIKKAYKIAKNIQEKKKAEALLVKTIPNKIFDLTIHTGNGKNTKLISSNPSDSITNVITTQTVNIKATLKSNFLEYGDYDVKVRFNIKATYSVVNRALLLSVQKDETSVNTKDVVFHITKRDGYSITKSIDLQDIITYSSTHMGKLAGGTNKLKNIQISGEVVDSKLIK